jgi:general secretion pathway protein B
VSFILDALRKSEHARQHLGGPTLAELPLGRRPRAQPWWVFALAGLLLVNLVALTLVLVRKEPRIEPSTVSTQITVDPRASSPAEPMKAISTAAQSVPVPLVDEAEPQPNVQYETVLRSESPLAAQIPDGPTLVKPIDAPPVNTLPSTAEGLPELHIDMHVWSKMPKDRIVWINKNKYTEGQTLAEGPRIVEITANGVSLLYQGQQVHLPRP